MRRPSRRLELRPRETWTVEQLEDLRRRWWSGESAWRLSQHFWIGVGAIERRVRAYGFVRSPRFRRRSSRVPKKAQLAEMRALYENGTAAWAIADRYGREAADIHYLARRHGWARPAGHRERIVSTRRWEPTEAQAEWLRANWISDQMRWDFEHHLRASMDSIRRAAKRMGLPERTPRALAEARCANSDARRRQDMVVRAINGGASVADLVTHLGMKENTARAYLQKARKRGVKVRSIQLKWSPTEEDRATVAAGYRLGIFIKTIARLLGAPDRCSKHCVFGLAKRMGLDHRNIRANALNVLSPECLATYARTVGNPVDLVQKFYRMSRQMTERQALRALDDYAEALRLFPEIVAYREPLKGYRTVEPRRAPSKAIEARRLEFEQHGEAYGLSRLRHSADRSAA
ncbi:hypothetical protein [Methylosinus sp. sav-2]|uniref:hypothetical protein n=1 Tax=Methylosinus sp. sav-2 TaxID=2485168 RepID=UPI00047A9593|nr:hypothetical protein [Methylosinus sp. sav-2]